MFYHKNELCLEETDQCSTCERVEDGLCPFLIFSQCDFMSERIPEMEYFELDFECPKYKETKIEISFTPESYNNIVNIKDKR